MSSSALELDTSEAYPIWIGLRDFAGNNTDFRWTNDDRLNFTNWHINNPTPTGNCVVVAGSNVSGLTTGIWYNLPCTNDFPAALCETEKVSEVGFLK